MENKDMLDFTDTKYPIDENKANKSPQKTPNKKFRLKLGVLAVAFVLLFCATLTLFELLPSDDLADGDYADVMQQCDLAVFGAYKGKTEKLTYSEYTFGVTEVLKGEVTQKEITVRSEKRALFSDEMEKYARAKNASFEKGNEYFLALQGSVLEGLSFHPKQIVSVYDIGNAAASESFSALLEAHQVTSETSREDLKEFFKYIFYGSSDESQTTAKEDFIFDLNKDGESYILTKYTGNSRYVTVPDTYKKFPVTAVGSSAFKSNKNIISVRLPETITIIDAFAFRYCDNLVNVNIPSSVTVIGYGAFEKCISLVSISIPESVSSIDKWTFLYCSSLKDVKLSSNTTYIGDFAFSRCHALEKIELPESLVYLDEGAFFDCRGLTEITVPKNTSVISPNVFNACDSLTSISVDKDNKNYYVIDNCLIDAKTNTVVYGTNNSRIPTDPKITTIGVSAFNCAKITEIVIPGNITTIGENAFNGCPKLEKLTISEGVTKIEFSAFIGCEKLTNVEIPNSVSIIEGNAFYNCPLEYNVYNGMCYLGNTENPYAVFIKPIDNTTVSEAVLPEGVKIVYAGSFADAKVLKNVYLPEGVVQIGTQAFSKCPELTNIRIPDSIEHIDASVFRGSATCQYNLYEGVNYLGNEHNPYLVVVSLEDLTLTDVKLHDKSRIILNEAFKGESYSEHLKLSSINIPSGIISIGQGAFTYTTINKVHIESLEAWLNIDFAIDGGSPLYTTASKPYINGKPVTSVVIPDTVTVIKDRAFTGFRDLSEIVIPDSVTHIGDYAFAGCGSLKSIVIPDSVVSLGENAFYASNALSNVQLSDNLRIAPEFMFITDLRNITIPNGATKIVYDAFRGSGIGNVNIPKSVIYIDGYAFASCLNLKTITYDGTIEEWNRIKKDYKWQIDNNRFSVICTDGKISY